MDGPLLKIALARIHTFVGNHAKALELLERSHSTPAGVTTSELRLGPTWDALRQNPRFEKLSGQTPRDIAMKIATQRNVRTSPLYSAICRASACFSRNLKRRFGASLLALIVSGSAAHGQWTMISSESEFSSGRMAEHRHVVARSTAGDKATIDVALFSPKTATLHVIDVPGADTNLEVVMERENAIAGVNGGYFDPQYAPVGLLVSGGRVVAPQQKARLLSGVVSVVNGRVQVQRSAEFSLKTKPTAARQCGPFLVEGGKAVPGLNNSRKARRTFVLTMSADRAAIGFCSHVTLAELASLLATPEIISGGKVQRALNLDGGSSSGFWFAGEERPFSISAQKRVRDFLAIVAR